jgi:hypothetical protein
VLSFTFFLVDGAEVKMALTVKDDVMSGQWEHPEGLSGAVELKKKK